MSKTIKGFMVALKHDISEEYAQKVCDAIKVIAGVSDVQQIESDMDDFLIRSQIKHELGEKFFRFYNDITK